MYIGGEWVDARDGATFDVTNPATGEVIGAMPDGGTIVLKPAEATLLCAKAVFEGIDEYLETKTGGFAL